MPIDPPHTNANTHRQMHTLTLPLTHLSHTQTTLSYTNAHSPTRVYTLTYMTALSALTYIHTTPHACSYTSMKTYVQTDTSQIQSHTSTHTRILCHPTHTVTYLYSITHTYSHILILHIYTYPVHIHSHKSMLSHTCALRLPHPHLHAVPHTYTHTIP